MRAVAPPPSQGFKRGQSEEGRNRGEETEEVPHNIRPALREHRSRSLPLRGNAQASEDPRGTASFLEGCGAVFPEEETKFWETERPAVSFAMDLPKVTTISKARSGAGYGLSLCEVAEKTNRGNLRTPAHTT